MLKSAKRFRNNHRQCSTVLTCGDIFIRSINTILIASLQLLNLYFSIFWYSKSNAKENKLEIQDFHIPANYVSEDKVCLMN